MASNQSPSERPQQLSGPSFLEWLSGAVGAVLALGILAFIAYEALNESSKRPPVLQVRPTSAVKADDLYVVEVGVRNRSGQTAAAVEVKGELTQGGRSVETSNATIGYVPGHSERTAGLVFSHDPRSYEFRVRATGFEKP